MAVPVIEDEPKVETWPEAEPGPLPFPWLTLETVLYALLFILALSLRLWLTWITILSDARGTELTDTATLPGDPLG